MAKNTALRAENNKVQGIIFKDKEHKNFYSSCLSKCRYPDSYHQALVYCLGMSEDTRRNIKHIYDFKSGNVKPKCLQEGWQTSESQRIVRVAFNLYCDGTPSTYDYKDVDEQIRETRLYSVSDLFCTEDAPYFWEAIKIRYPEYGHNDKEGDCILC
mgnify:FL=1